MREVKFRGKTGRLNNWVYGSYQADVMSQGTHTIMYSDYLGFYVEDDVDPKTVGQFTGLKDKNGKEIYEGDILQYKHYYAIKKWWRTSEEIKEIEESVQRQRDNYQTESQQVVFAEGSFRLGYNLDGRDILRGEKFERGSGNTNDFEERYWDFEVIGNIHENPELLQ